MDDSPGTVQKRSDHYPARRRDLSAFLGHAIEAVAIAAIVLFAVLLGFYQEYRAERAMDALRQMAAPTATVVRDGRECEIPARDLVPGDIVVLHTGNKVPADARMILSSESTGGRGGAYRRIRPGGETKRAARSGRTAGGRPAQHGFCGHRGYLRARARRRRRHRHGH